MTMRQQRGFTLLESTIAVAIIAVAASALLFAMGETGRFSSHQAGPVRSAATVLAQQTLRVAQDAWKYGTPGTSPAGSVQTSVPILIPNNTATTAPVSLRTVITSSGADAAQIAVTVSYTPDPDHPRDPGSVTLNGNVQVKSPLPASTVAPAALIPQPAGAP